MPETIRETVAVDTQGAVQNLDEAAAAAQRVDERLDDLKAKLGLVDGEEVTIPISTPGAPAAVADLEHVDKAARAAGGGAKIGVSAISDLAGPLGDASSKAGEMGQAVEGLGQVLGPMATKMGMSTEAVGKMTGGLGIAAIAVAAGTALWTLYREKQEKARKAVEDMTATQESFAAGKFEEAADKLVESNMNLFAILGRLNGITIPDITKAIARDPAALERVNRALDELGDGVLHGQMSGMLADASAAWAEANTAMEKTTDIKNDVEGALKDIADAAAGTAGKVSDLADEFDALAGALDIESSVLDVEDALQAIYDAHVAAGVAARGSGAEQVAAQRDTERAIIRAKNEVIDYANAVGDLPAESVTKILALIDEGSLAEARLAFDNLTADKTVNINVNGGGSGVTTGWAPSAASGVTTGWAPTTTVVNNFAPSNTPLAVQAAQQRWEQTQGPGGP